MDLDGDGRAERRVGQAAFQHVTRLEGARLRVGGIRQLAQFRRAREPAAIQGRAPRGTDRRTQGFGELDDRFAAPGMRHTDDDLPGADDLARLRQGLHHHAVRVGEQDRVAGFVARNVGPGLGRIELRPCRLRGRPDIVVGRGRNRALGDEGAVSRLVLRGLARARRGGGNGLLVGARGEPQVRGIDAHERLAALDGLPGIDQALQDLAGNAKSQVALHPRGNNAGERTLGLDGDFHRSHPHQRNLGLRID